MKNIPYIILNLDRGGSITRIVRNDFEDIVGVKKGKSIKDFIKLNNGSFTEIFREVDEDFIACSVPARLRFFDSSLHPFFFSCASVDGEYVMLIAEEAKKLPKLFYREIMQVFMNKQETFKEESIQRETKWKKLYDQFYNEMFELNNEFVITQRELAKRNAHLKKANAMINDQYRQKMDQIAKEQDLQRHLNPQELPDFERIDLRAFYLPSEELGGDTFSVWKTSGGHLGVVLIDCMGHGIEASMNATLMKAVVDHHLNYFKDSPDISGFLSAVNREACRYLIEGQYPTVFAGVIDPVKKKLYYGNANGKLPLIKYGSHVLEVPAAEGMHIAYDMKTQYEQKEASLQNADTVLFFSDAIVEMKGKDGYWVGDEPLKTLMSDFTSDIQKNMENIRGYIEPYLSSERMDDDLTLILASF